MMAPLRSDPVDWFRVIQDLLDRQFSLAQISAATNIPRSTLRDWRNLVTSSPSHDDGDALIEFWLQITNLPRENLPRTQNLAGFRQRKSIQLRHI